LTAMVYSALTLNSQRAYAATCTPAFCNGPVSAYRRSDCIGEGYTERTGVCDIDDPGYYSCTCSNGLGGEGFYIFPYP
jgi:hypothetical protein